jgi:putative membrane protein
LLHPAVVAKYAVWAALPHDRAVHEEQHMAWLTPSLTGIPNFFLYGAIGLVLTGVFAVAYIRITGHDELKLIRDGNASAALAFGGSLIGFAHPLSKAIAQASSIPDCVLWGLIALIVQLLAYAVARLLIPDLSKKIELNTMAAAITLASVSIVAGMLNAASMTYYPTVGGVIEAL